MRPLALTLAGALLVAGCSGGSTDSGAGPGPTRKPAPASESGSPGVTTASGAPTPPTADAPFNQQTGAQIAAAGSAAMKQVTSLHYRLSVRGVPKERQLAVDVRADDSGSCTGTIDLGAGRIEIRGVGDEQWFRADVAAWRATQPDSADDLIAAAGGHWVLDEGFEYANFCLFDDLLGGMLEDVGSGSWFAVGSDRVDGHDVIRVQSSQTQDGLAVAAVRVDEPHYLASFQRTDDSDGAVSTGRFSDFGVVVVAQAPADDDVVDLSALR